MNPSRWIRYLLFPDCACLLCRRDAVLGGDRLCDACRSQLRVCIAPAPPAPLDGLTAGLIYEGAAAAAMHAYKYQAGLQYAAFFARYMSVPALWNADCLIPMPLHPLKLWLRGYNQSEILCEALADTVALPIRTDLVRRTRFTRTQTHLDSGARAANVRHAFTASGDVNGLSVVLVDDVTTTHATLVACAAALKKAGARRVYAACACMTEYAYSGMPASPPCAG